MRKKVRLYIRKLIALVLAIFMSTPASLFAAEDKNEGTNPTIMSQREAETKEKVANVTNPTTTNLGSYDLSTGYNLGESLEEITYKLDLKRDIDPEEDKDISLSLTPSPNSNIKDLKLVIVTSNGVDVESITNDPSFEKGLESLVINTKAHQDLSFEIKAKIRKAQDKRDYKLIVGLAEDGKSQGTKTLSLVASENMVTDGEDLFKELSLEKDEAKESLRGSYEDKNLLASVFSKEKSILWTSYLANDSEDTKDLSYNFDLDANQST